MPKEDNDIPYNDIEYTNSSRAIFVGPCVVKCIMLAADGANGDCWIYNGVNSTGDLKGHIEALSGTSFQFAPPGGALFRKGLYITVNAVTSIVTVTLRPVSPKDV